MNPEIELQQILREHNAVLIRQKKHLVYRLPNGQKFVTAKTPGDPDVAARNNVHNLRRLLGIERKSNKKGEKMPVEEMAVAMPTPQTLLMPRTQEPSTQESLKARIETTITLEEAAQEKLLAEAQAHERRVQMLKALLPFAEEPAIEESLRGVLPIIEPPAPPKPEPTPAEPPQAITERVQVTAQLVFAATQTFEDTFTVNDVLALMTGGRQIDRRERLRVRQAIADAMIRLHGRGELVKEEQGVGRQQTTWRKVAMNGRGS